MIGASGHKVKYFSSKDKGWKKALDRSCDIIAVAGGDGTVDKVARHMGGRATPIAILPVGIANNIAHGVGLTGRALEQWIMEWESARRVNFDVGKATGPWELSISSKGLGSDYSQQRF